MLQQELQVTVGQPGQPALLDQLATQVPQEQLVQLEQQVQPA